MRFVTSDTHFGHQRIIELCNRPFLDVRHMNEEIVRRWNERVRPEDEVFHLGDVALGAWVEWDALLTRLNGRKILVEGNHDRVFRGAPQRQQDRFLEHYARWFDIIVPEVTNFPFAGTRVNFSHFPYDGDSHGDDRYTDFRLPDEGRVLIHGHTHQKGIVSHSTKGTLQIHAGQDAWDFMPVSETVIATLIRNS